MMSAPHESRLCLKDGTELFIRDWYGESYKPYTPQPSIVVMHGLGEHCGRYEHVAPFLNSCGFSVRTFDHRGHGQSDGKKGDVPKLTAFIEDAEFVIQDFVTRCQTTPIILGHSMGGLIAAHVATTGNVSIRGLILSSPALALRLSMLDRIALKVMLRVAPHLAINNGLNAQWLSHDTAVCTAYENDPLVHKKITASLLQGMLHSIEYAQTHAPLLNVPVLLMVAESDRLVDPKGSHDFFDCLPRNVGTAHYFANFYHEIFNEANNQIVFDELRNWLTVRNFVA